MSDRAKFERAALKLVSTREIAEATTVTHSAVCNWVMRWADFPVPVARYGNTDVYPRDEIEDCLRRHKRSFDWKGQD